MLLRAEQISGAAYLKIAERDTESRAERRVLADCRKPFFRDLRKRLVLTVGEIRICAPRAPSDTSAYLMKLRKPVPIRVLDYERIRIRNVHSRFDDRRGHEHIDLSADKLCPYFLELFPFHSSVSHSNARIGHHALDLRCDLVHALDAVVQIERLSPAPKLLAERLGDHGIVVFHNVRLDGRTHSRRLLKHAHIDYTAHRHVQRPRDRRSRQRQHVGVG